MYGPARQAASILQTKALQKPFRCKWEGCDKSFSRKKGLKAHEHVHRKTFKCPDCEHCAESSAQLTRHRRMHTGEKPYVCDYPGCGWAFTTSSQLACHRRTHTGEKPYVCDYPGCGWAFTASCSLKRHCELFHTAAAEAHRAEAAKSTSLIELTVRTELNSFFRQQMAHECSIRGIKVNNAIRFESQRLLWALTDKGYPHQVDCLLVGVEPEEAMAVEVHGGQHYAFIPYFHRSEEHWTRQQELDASRKQKVEAVCGEGKYHVIDARKLNWQNGPQVYAAVSTQLRSAVTSWINEHLDRTYGAME